MYIYQSVRDYKREMAEESKPAKPFPFQTNKSPFTFGEPPSVAAPAMPFPLQSPAHPFVDKHHFIVCAPVDPCALRTVDFI